MQYESGVESRLNMEQNRSDLGCVYSRTETLECPNVVGVIDCICTEEGSKQPRNVRLVAYAVISVTTNAAIKAPQIDGRCTFTSPVFVALGAVLVTVKGGCRWCEERICGKRNQGQNYMK